MELVMGIFFSSFDMHYVYKTYVQSRELKNKTPILTQEELNELMEYINFKKKLKKFNKI
jgi:hypothetical protein